MSRLKQILVKKNILKNNDNIAMKNKKFLDSKGIYTINLLGSPGSGKTSLLEEMIEETDKEINMAVIEGDLYTDKDAKRIEKHNIDVVQVNTGGACHLEASMITDALKHINIEGLDFLVIENVGNLVCPASYDLSEDIKITVMSVTEGNDKPLKYPAMFQKSSVVVLNKMDMIELTDFDLDEFYKNISLLNGDTEIFEVSCRTKEGVNELCKYLKEEIKRKKDNGVG